MVSMFLTSQKAIMSGQVQNAETERQHLLERLLDAVKQCQVRFGGKTELATDGDSRVVCLLTQYEAVFQHGFKRTRASAFRQVGQVAGIVKLDSEAVFWNFVKVHLGKLEEERFISLQKATTDAGKGRAWLRSTLNEHSLERYLHNMLGNKSLLSQFYEKEAFLMDEERASMLPMTAAGLSPILFALTVDNEELNIVRQQAPTLPINKEVLTSILPSFPHKPVEEPAPVVSAVLTDDTKVEKKKKKKKKKRNAAIVSFEEGENQEDLTSDLNEFPINDTSAKETMNSSNDTSVKETMNLSSEWNSSSTGHTRSSSYPGNITVVSEGSEVKSSRVNGQEVVFTEITKSVSLPDNSVAKENIALGNSTTSGGRSFKFEDFLEGETIKTGSDTEGEGVQEAPSVEDTGNFVFEAADMFFNHPNVGFEEENLFQIQSDLKTSSIPTCSEETNDSARIAQGGTTLPREDLPERKDEFCGENLGSDALSAVTSDFSKEHNLPYSKQNYDSADTHSLAEKDSEKSKFFVEHAKIPGLVKEIAADLVAKIIDMPLYLNHANASSLQANNADTQKQQDRRESPLEMQDQQKTVECKDLYKDTSSSLDHFDSAQSSEAEPSASDSKFEPVVLLDSGESLVPVAEGDVTSTTGTQSTFHYAPDVSAESDRDSLSSPSWSFVEDSEGLIEIRSEPLLNSNGSSVAMASDASTAAALAACSDAQRGMDNMASGLITMGATITGDQNVRRDDRKRQDGMTSAELKQAMVSMMLRKDEIEEQNRKLQSRLDEECQKSQQLDSENEKLREEIKQQGNFNAAKIASLSRENELLKHQLKKYVGAVQALRSDLQGNKSAVTAEVLSGIRQEQILPPLPPEQVTLQASEEAEEYKRKLIQVADLHGELLEFNERLLKQVSYYQLQVRRLREELVNLRGPLPEYTESLSDSTSLSDFDPAVMSVGTRPLVNVWIPSVFLRGRSSNVHHVYQVYVRIKDDEWNIYRRYSQFFEMHKNLRRKSQVVESFKFPPKKTLGNKDSRFVEDRRRLLQDYLRRVVNLYVTEDRELRENTSKAVLLQIIPFFAEPFPPEKVKKESSRRRRSLNYTGL